MPKTVTWPARPSKSSFRLFFGAVAFGLAFMIPMASALGATNAYYLTGGGVPEAGLSPNAPTAGSLPNFDPDRDEFAGLLLHKSNHGAEETQPNKYQMWVAPPGSVNLTGPASLTFWSAMKDFDVENEGGVAAYLLDCNPSGIGCTVIGQGSTSLDPWSGGSGSWVSRTISFGSVTHTIAADRALAIKVVVANDSGDDMWFAYDTSAQASVLTVNISASATTTTTIPATTTTTAITTSTTSPPSTTTTSAAPAATATTPPASGSTRTTTQFSEIPPEGSGADNGQDPPSSGPPNSADFGDAIDRTLQPLPAPSSGTGERAPGQPGLSLSLMEGLELVVPPGVAAAILSPLLILEFLLRAIASSFQAVTVPAMLLGLAVPWALTEGRLGAFWSRKGKEEEGTRT